MSDWGFCSFLVLFILFVVAIEFSETDTLNITEVAFMVYALGFSLEKIAAMQEHGIGGQHGFNVSSKPSLTFL